MSEAERINQEKTIVDLAWTAGWDSTFRLLQLLLIKKKCVRPHYIVRSESSTGQEIDAMNRIRRKLFADWPETRKALMPTRFVDVRSILIKPEINAEYERVKEQKKVVEQYLLLACYRFQERLDKIEIGIHSGDSRWRLAGEKLFEGFSLPLHDLDKKGMRRLAIEHGFADIMDLTVFCRRPKRGKPCGFCGPCHDAVALGMGYRLPLTRRLVATLQSPLRRWWRGNYAQMNPTLKRVASRFLGGRY